MTDRGNWRSFTVDGSIRSHLHEQAEEQMMPVKRALSVWSSF